MALINSVLGPLDTAQLGTTLCHEHVLETSAGIPQVYPEFVDWEAVLGKAAAILEDAYSGGLRTIVDVTTLDLGRDIRFLEQVSRRSGVQVVCATGMWLDLPRAFRYSDPDDVARLFVREIEEGIEGSGIRAGVIKVATGPEGVTPEGEIVLRAAARAHKATGVPISTHSPAPERVGEAQVRIFEEEGVSLDRVCVGHSDDTTDMSYLLGLLDKGAWIGLDQFRPHAGNPGTPDWKGRTATCKNLIDAGFGDRVMLSHDWSVMMPSFSAESPDERLSGSPDHYLFISRNVVPRLREIGVSEEDSRKLLEANPRRFFEGA